MGRNGAHLECLHIVDSTSANFQDPDRFRNTEGDSNPKVACNYVHTLIFGVRYETIKMINIHNNIIFYNILLL